MRVSTGSDQLSTAQHSIAQQGSVWLSLNTINITVHVQPCRCQVLLLSLGRSFTELSSLRLNTLSDTSKYVENELFKSLLHFTRAGIKQSTKSFIYTLVNKTDIGDANDEGKETRAESVSGTNEVKVQESRRIRITSIVLEQSTCPSTWYHDPNHPRTAHHPSSSGTPAFSPPIQA